MKSLVSVVVPAYNRREIICETLDSIFNQSYRPIELIIVDDGSSDGTGEVIREWANKKQSDHFRMSLFFQSNQGVSAARNAGMEKAIGEYIQLLDSDDLILPEKIQKQVEILENNPLSSYCWSKTSQINSEGRELARLGKPIRDRLAEIPDHNWHISSLLLRKEILKDVGGFSEDLTNSNDWEFAARVKAFGGEGIFLDRMLSFYRIHEGPQIIKSGKIKYAKAREKAIHKIFHLLSTLSERNQKAQNKCSRLLFHCAITYAQEEDYSSFWRNLNQARKWSGSVDHVIQNMTYLFFRVFPPRFIFPILMNIKHNVKR